MPVVLVVFSLTHPTATETYTLSLHDALPIWFRFSSGRDGTPSPTYSVRIAGHVVATRQLAIFATTGDRKSTRLNSSHLGISYAVFCLKKKTDLRPARRGRGRGARGRHQEGPL